MEPESNPTPNPAPERRARVWNTVTPVSKYLAMALFVVLPFIGGWVGYQYGQEKHPRSSAVNGGNVIPKETLATQPADESEQTPTQTNVVEDGAYIEGRYWKLYSVPWTDLTVAHPAGWLVDEEGTWSGVMYAFLDYAWPAELPIEDYLDYSHEMYSGSLYDVLDAYYSDPTHTAERDAFDERHDQDRENGIEGVTMYYIYKASGADLNSLSALDEDLPIVINETRTLGEHTWRVGTINDDIDVMLAEFEKVFVLFLTDTDDPDRQAVMHFMAEHVRGKGILADDHPGCCY